jgi:orotidine-5'-phosphate decarboxylase
MNNNIIIALDFNNKEDALDLIAKLDPNQCILKIGSEMYTLFGPELVKSLVKKHFKIFLDLKFYDISTTVAKSCSAACDLGVWMISVHASGGVEMLMAARNAIDAHKTLSKPLLIAVTILTSFKQDDLKNLAITESLEQVVCRLAYIAKTAKCDGVVSSASEVPMIKKLCGADFLTVTPGIRPSNTNLDDQIRALTPKQAISLGSDYLVIGRPITKSIDPLLVIERLYQDE